MSARKSSQMRKSEIAKQCIPFSKCCYLPFIRQLLLDVHIMMKRLIRAIEAIPLHLSLGIVRLDDGLGESWAIPLQACRTVGVCDVSMLSIT